MNDQRWRLRAVLTAAGACLAATLLIPGAGLAADGRARLYTALDGGEDRPGLAAPAAAAGPALRPAAADGSAWTEDGPGPSPFLAGLMSAIVPGSGQLALGQKRGWLYLGVESAAWFSRWALRDAGNQSEEDYKEFADGHWDWDRYESVSDCGEGIGPIDFEAERDALRNAYDNSRDDFYDDIGGQSVYACGWDDQVSRGRYEGMRDDADTLFRSARYAVTLAFFNHVVSAIDAAKSASNRRRDREREYSIDWNVNPTPRGDLAVRVEFLRRF